MASSSTKAHPWFEICHPRPSARYQVFIFPAAGAPGSFYRQWDKDLSEFEFSIVVYPGRSSRIKDPLITNLNDYIKGLDQGLVPFINRPCIFIGHSIGCLISFALAKHMINTINKGHFIRLMIQMGRGPIDSTEMGKSLADMTDTEIVEDMKRGADPSTKYIYDIPSYAEMLIPILRADGQVGKEILPKIPLNIPIVAYGGEKEEYLNESMLDGWKDLTTIQQFFRVRMFPGHHNFPSECSSQVLTSLKEDLNNILSISQIQ